MKDLAISRRVVAPIGVAVLVLQVIGCGSRGNGTSGEKSIATTTDSAPVISGGTAPDTCVWPDRGPVQIQGTVRREQRLGPPGYGETPKRDEKLEIFVLHTPTSIRFCADTAIKQPPPEAQSVEDFQLTGAVDTTELRRLIGTKQTIYGGFVRQAWGSDFTPILIRVDSIAGGLRGLQHRS